jgi:hypothetical protein
MNSRFPKIFTTVTALTLSACFHQAQMPPVQKDNVLPVRTIAVFPVTEDHQTSRAPELLRKQINAELHFRGYETTLLELLDEKLKQAASSDAERKEGNAAEKFIDYDAAMQCKILQDNIKKGLFYSPIMMEAECQLRRSKTKELLWEGKAKAKNYNFDITPKRLERKIYETYETVIGDVVEQLLEKFPDGPNLR